MSDIRVSPSLATGLESLRRRWPEAVSPSQESPVFILAAGWRSGSTLLQRLLMPSCFVWGEPYGHAGLIESLADVIRSFTDAWPEAHFLFNGEDAVMLSRTFHANLYPPVDELLRAHLAFFDSLFAQPARRAGAERWGVKEVRWSADHAVYLKWLYPQAKFLFLVRSPYDAYRSWAARRNAGWRWHKRWPDRLLTVGSFGRHWRDLVTGFLDGHRSLDALLVRYEDLAAGRLEPIEAYLGFPLSREAASLNPSDTGPPPLEKIPEPELIELQREVGGLAAQLGYHCETAKTDQAPVPEDASTTIHVGVHESGSGASDDALDPARCVVLVPVGSAIEPACDDALYELQRRGYQVRRVRGYSAIDQGRNQMAADALHDGFQETMWIDSDIAFDPDDVLRLRRHELPIVSGIYPKKGKRELASHILPGTQKLVFGAEGGLAELRYAATGFLLVRKEVYAELQRQLNLPLCNERFGRPTIPFFQPLIIPDGDGQWYLAEDYAFSERVRQCGFKIYADTTIRLGHIGRYAYTWEDAGSDKRRYATYHFHFAGAPSEARGETDGGAGRIEAQPQLRQPASGAGAPAPAGDPGLAGPPLTRNVHADLPNRRLPYHFPGGKIFLNVAESPAMVAQALGLYEPYQSKAVMSLLKPGMVFVDVGAGTGYYSLLAARVVGEQGCVLALESNPEHCRWLRKSIEVNGYQHVQLFETEAGTGAGVTSGDGRNLAESSYSESHTQRCAAQPALDDILDQRLSDRSVDLLRVAIDGTHPPLWHGARRTLASGPALRLIIQARPAEIAQTDELVEQLRQLGFSLFDIRGPGTHPLKTVAGLDCFYAERASRNA